MEAAMRSPDFTRTAATLPALYHEDLASYEQLDGYLGLADAVQEAMLELLEDLEFAVGPDAALRWPTDVPLDSGADALLAELTVRYDALAGWFAYETPGSWGASEAGLATRRLFLSKAARLWRRRGTPSGFVDWFCLYFGVTTPKERPYLLEHFKVPGGTFDAEPFTGTLFVPNSEPFEDYRRRLEAAQFARWYAPAHVALRVCYVSLDALEAEIGLTGLPVLDPDATEDEVGDYADLVAQHAIDLRTLACSVVSVVNHTNGIRIYGCGLDGDEQERSIDLLGIGKLPTTPTSLTEDIS
jgi:hypothetical protein